MARQSQRMSHEQEELEMPKLDQFTLRFPDLTGKILGQLFGNLVRRPPLSSHEFPLFNILQRGHFYGRQMALATVGFQHLSNLNHKK